MRTKIITLGLLTILLFPLQASAAVKLTYRYKHHLFALTTDGWEGEREYWTYQGQAITPAPQWRVDGDNIPPLPEGVKRKQQLTWDPVLIKADLKKYIADSLNREPQDVIISRDEEDNITFEGVGMLGREVDLSTAVELTIEALKNQVSDITLVVEETQPKITVNDGELKKMGIKEIISIGESKFDGSPFNRRHNIGVGLARFNGHLIPKGEIFSFNQQLGDVNYSTGYREELVIVGDKTLPEYGGGLCQVSTTAYRGIWEYGFPIEQRRNHSYAVQYYSPQGTDATIYPPATDMKFLNDSPGAILIQTYVNQDDSKAYFIYYGTSDGRQVELLGPYVWGQRAPPADRTEFTNELPPGEKKKVGGRVPGLSAAWHRIITRPKQEEVVETFESVYQARPLYYMIGIEDTSDEPPSWITAEPDPEG